MIIFKMTWIKNHEIKGKIGSLLILYLQPGASKTAVRGLYQDRLKLSIQSPPVEGAANAAVIEFLSKTLKIPKNKIHFISGETSRQKNLWLECEAEKVRSALVSFLENI